MATVWHVAWPEALIDCEEQPRLAPLEVKPTVPPPAPGLGDTVPVKVTEAPLAEGLLELVRVVVVEVLL